MTCECCPNQGQNYVKHMTMIMCPECLAKEKALQLESNANAEHRVNEHNETMSLKLVEKIDYSNQIKSDIFNAETVSILEIKKIIDSDATIENKNFALAKQITDRINHFKKTIFEKNDEIIELSNKQRVVQTYLNNLSNSLRIEEREQIKLADINYKPAAVKPVKSKAINLAKPKKYDKTELHRFTNEINEFLISKGKAPIPESILQMVCVSRNMTPEQAANELKSKMG